MSVGTEHIWDPLRKKEVTLTPEERVRQWFIAQLRDTVGVPEHQMMSEVQMRYGNASKIWRADILVYAKGGAPLAVVECKRPEIRLTREVLDQALRYMSALGVTYIIITNGSSCIVARQGQEGVEFLQTLPSYSEMQR